jgi:2-methylfumaryl-CoA hydratase
MINSTKIQQGRFFEDFKLNEVIQHATPRTITQGDAALYIALTGERNPLHCSAPFAISLGYRDTPVDDLLAFHIAFGKTVPDISVNAVANLGYADVRFLQPVFIGDTLSTSSQVIGLKQNSSGKNGVVWVRSTAVNQNNTAVLSWVRWVMVHKHDVNAAAPATVIPDLPKHVAPEQLQIASYFDAHNEISTATAGQYFWEDYQVGERLNHPAGMTINDSDHSLATRLYQNNARLHFDAHLMQSAVGNKRLVYGGVVISACRALSYEGLENALSILAINGGTHANPSYAGDTIYTLSEVLDKWELPQQGLGALRLRMVGLKNMPSADIGSIKTEQGYHQNVVLDLDYTVLIPRRGKSI